MEPKKFELVKAKTMINDKLLAADTLSITQAKSAESAIQMVMGMALGLDTGPASRPPTRHVPRSGMPQVEVTIRIDA